MSLKLIYFLIIITESQNGPGWKGPLDVILCNTAAQARPPRANCIGPRPDGCTFISGVSSYIFNPLHI